MVKNHSAFVAFLAIIFFGWAATFLEAQQGAAGKQPVRVLYVEGAKKHYQVPVDPNRGADFRQFLEHHFSKVEVCKDVEFTPALASDVDVIIVDGDISERLPADFRRPMVLLGDDFTPLFVAEHRGYKLHNL